MENMSLTAGSIDFFGVFRGKSESLGIFAKDGVMYAVSLTRGEEGFIIRRAIRERYDGDGDDAPDLAHAAYRAMAVNALTASRVVICQPRAECFIYDRSFPDMPEDEMNSAIKWDVEANAPFPDGGMWYGAGTHRDMVEISAIDAVSAEAMVREFSDLGIRVVSMTMEPLAVTLGDRDGKLLWRKNIIELPPDMTAGEFKGGYDIALFAALHAFFPKIGIELLPKEYRKDERPYVIGGGVLLAAFFLFAALSYIVSEWQIFTAAEKLDSVRREMALMESDILAVRNIREDEKRLQADDNLIEKLSKKRRSWYHVMSVLGSVSSPGVRITEIRVTDDGAISCTGLAEGYDTLLGFIDAFADDGFERPTLKETAKSDDGLTRFVLLFKF